MTKHSSLHRAPETSKERGKLLLLAGNIGVGKTSIAEILGQRLGWDIQYESVDDNPYLEDFYNDSPKWVFMLGVFFLASRATQHLKAYYVNTDTILDRSIYEDRFVFIPALAKAGVFSSRDLSTYELLWELIADALPVPDLIIHLTAPIEVLRKRISRRGRAMEKGITSEYLQSLEWHYSQWIDSFDLCPVLHVDASSDALIRQGSAQDMLVSEVVRHLENVEEAPAVA